ncbi:superfamily II DNA or RNA helicase [Parabacteroides sp. PF5-5]|uniref:helicase-related protein n=1 Tax=unclassified Parabacteroides TaxID=2649774 RepID=UPI0024739DF6|nr:MULTISPECIES: helicase-related protein [unclassified Parabacteroides]MDH6304212.1 superfamily II DNA or RNA helicase [Parabacteroides sp. PH5-39]MDH6312375.1 superfamily II DNA or RNA helicase [Parabacteroides sp. PFB2-10]MDH6315073.1 superfamily II DNA or RNA helicase [Parabacteroides sp. PF5-13]MDH6318733.1 superfamily II DNA or RNA helicase [Parabacteroides sp. PH5-13]MDH6322463.1 superfamily II DNA or RNA helicase [Parabacteroides sp. PH5-8]
MSSKFFTNENENTLLNKIKGIFEHKNIHFFDALVGYFRASGYFQVRPFVDKAAEIRVLVGINIDEAVYDANNKGLLFTGNEDKSIDTYIENLKKDIQSAKYDKTIEDGMLQFIQDLIEKKVSIRVYPKQNLHAKIYIFREVEKHTHGYGSVITGSSNLTDNGLQHNFEFNVELRDDADIDFATETFERLWEQSIEIEKDFVEKLKTETYLNDSFTPFEIYYKFLIEYFGKSVEYDPNSLRDLPKEYKKLSYQADAVNDGYAKLEKHNGFFLSDVVGLGKTVVAAQIAKNFFYHNGFPDYLSKTLVICPPALYDNWQETFDKFGINDYKIHTNGSLHKIRNARNYDLVIVDEAHKFRNDSAEMYNALQKICKTPTRRGTQKKIMLVSATPLNNRPEDIANQVYLFQDKKDSTLEISNLQHFFAPKIKKYKELKKESNVKKMAKEVKALYEEIRKYVVEPLTVRRTRTDLLENEEYAKDLREQGITFPVVKQPIKILYQLDYDLEMLYDKTIKILRDELTYYRYQTIKFLIPEKKKKYKNAELASLQLKFIMKTLLVKRLDSSFFAFRSSLERFAQATANMVKMFDDNLVFIAPNLDVNKYIEEDREEELLQLLVNLQDTDPSIEICTATDFEDGFVEGLKSDFDILQNLVKEWKKVKTDPKLDIFKDYLRNKLLSSRINKEGKLVVFSESQETTNYLYEELKKEGFDKILAVNSKNRKDKFPLLRENFDANLKKELQKNDYDIVISTEVLAEGVNMHRANVIVNYDTPWNSTRLMQRIGRVNRIGSTAKEVHVFNFFPTTKVENDIELQKKAILKLQAFHSALGEDSQIYSDEEIVESFGLFDKMAQEEKDEKLKILLELRKFKEENPELFKKIKNMTLRARTGREDKELHDTTIAFIRSEKRNSFLLVKENDEPQELTFLQAEEIYRAHKEEKPLPLTENHHAQVEKSITLFRQQLEAEKQAERTIVISQSPAEKQALSYLDAIIKLQLADKREEELLILTKEAVSLGKFQKLSKEISALYKNIKKVSMLPVKQLEAILKIAQNYPLQENEDKLETEKPKENKNFVPEIIISESFK